MTQPFDDKSVVYRFMPEPRGLPGYFDADEIVVTPDCDNASLLAVWMRFRKEWRRDQAWKSTTDVIAHLLKEQEELARILKEREHWADLQMRGMKILADTLKETIAECDTYKEALKQYADTSNWATMFEDTTTLVCWEGTEAGPRLAQEALGKKED